MVFKTLESYLSIGFLIICAISIHWLLRWASKVASSQDILLTCRSIVTEKFGDHLIAKVIAANFAILIYLLILTPPRAVSPVLYSTHTTSGFRALLGGLLFVGLLETIVVHVLVHLFSPTLAWFLTTSTLAGCLYMLGHIRALPRRHHEFSGETLLIKNGLLGTAHVTIADIGSVENVDGFNQDETPRFGILGKHDPVNIKIIFKSPQTYETNYGLRKTVASLLFHVDTPSQFIDAIKSRTADVG